MTKLVSSLLRTINIWHADLICISERAAPRRPPDPASYALHHRPCHPPSCSTSTSTSTKAPAPGLAVIVPLLLFWTQARKSFSHY